MTKLEWVQTDPNIWRSVDGRYVIVAQTLPEKPPRTVYQARRIDQAMAKAYPESGSMGFLLKESPWCWNEENSVHSAEAACERDLFLLTHPGTFNVPQDYPAVALSTFWWPSGNTGGRGALALVWKDGHLVVQLVGMHRRDEDSTEAGEYTEIDLTELGLVADPTALPTTKDHGPGPCTGCGAKAGKPHKDHCSHARCLVTGQQRLLCVYFGGSPAAGVEAVATNSQEEFERYFKTPTGHDCGSDIWRGEG
jgi:hypothetical protein